MKPETIEVQEPENLVQAITALHIKHNHPRPEDWKRELNNDANITSDKGIQRFLINRCFRSFLGDVTSENTMDARYCLVDTGEYNDWLRLFETGVLPSIIRLNLPVAMH